jgi:heme oxygenase
MTTFHAQIKLRSDGAHREAEEAPFIAELMGGALSAVAYLDYLRALAPIYLRMEELFIAHGGEEPLSYFDHRALDRAQHIAADIAYLEGQSGDVEDLSELSSVDTYLKTLNQEISPIRLTAHHYIRYLGDLSGGQAIARLVSRHYQIPAEALNFYNFDDIGDIVFYKKRYRDFLNLISLKSEEREEFLQEVELLYQLNRELFVDLGKIHSSSERDS